MFPAVSRAGSPFSHSLCGGSSPFVATFSRASFNSPFPPLPCSWVCSRLPVCCAVTRGYALSPNSSVGAPLRSFARARACSILLPRSAPPLTCLALQPPPALTSVLFALYRLPPFFAFPCFAWAGSASRLSCFSSSSHVLLRPLLVLSAPVFFALARSRFRPVLVRAPVVSPRCPSCQGLSTYSTSRGSLRFLPFPPVATLLAPTVNLFSSVTYFHVQVDSCPLCHLASTFPLAVPRSSSARSRCAFSPWPRSHSPSVCPLKLAPRLAGALQLRAISPALRCPLSPFPFLPVFPLPPWLCHRRFFSPANSPFPLHIVRVRQCRAFFLCMFGPSGIFFDSTRSYVFFLHPRSAFLLLIVTPPGFMLYSVSPSYPPHVTSRCSFSLLFGKFFCPLGCTVLTYFFHFPSPASYLSSRPPFHFALRLTFPGFCPLLYPCLSPRLYKFIAQFNLLSCHFPHIPHAFYFGAGVCDYIDIRPFSLVIWFNGAFLLLILTCGRISPFD